MRRPSWLVCIATDTVTRHWCGTVHLRMLSLAVPRWMRATERRRPKDRSWKGVHSYLPAGIPKRPLPNCQAGPTALSTPLFREFRDAQMPWGGQGPLTTSLRGGQWLPVPCNGGPCTRAATRKPTRREGDDSDPGLATRRERGPKLPPNGSLSYQRGLQHNEKGGGPKTPLCGGKGPETRLCCCGLSRQNACAQ